jgi:hypothetical protein
LRSSICAATTMSQHTGEGGIEATRRWEHMGKVCGNCRNQTSLPAISIACLRVSAHRLLT